MEEKNIKQVLIINVVSPGDRFQPIIGNDGIIEVPGLIYLEKGEGT